MRSWELGVNLSLNVLTKKVSYKKECNYGGPEGKRLLFFFLGWRDLLTSQIPIEIDNGARICKYLLTRYFYNRVTRSSSSVEILIYHWKRKKNTACEITLPTRFHSAVCILSIRSQMTSKCGKNKNCHMRCAILSRKVILVTFRTEICEQKCSLKCRRLIRAHWCYKLVIDYPTDHLASNSFLSPAYRCR